MIEALICTKGEHVLVRTRFHETIIAMFKEFSGHIHDKDEGYHIFRLADKDKLIQQLLGLNINVTEVENMPKQKKVEAKYKVDGSEVTLWIPFNEQLRPILRSMNAKFDSETCYYKLAADKLSEFLQLANEINQPVVEGTLPPPKSRKIEVCLPMFTDCFSRINLYIFIFIGQVHQRQNII